MLHRPFEKNVQPEQRMMHGRQSGSMAQLERRGNHPTRNVQQGNTFVRPIRIVLLMGT